MRVLLVGTADDRARVRAEIEHGSLSILGEFATLAQARSSRLVVDAIVLAAQTRQAADELADDIDEPLTAREREVLDLLVQGLSNKGIGARLGISAETVKFHVATICGKLEASNRTDAVRRAVRRGLVSL